RMAEDARTRFIDGLRVTADHLQHLQDRLSDGVHDLRRTVGLGHVAWGLHVQTADGGGAPITVTPGVAFSRSGLRLAIDAPVTLVAPDGVAPPWAVTLRGHNSDVEGLRVGSTATLI